MGNGPAERAVRAGIRVAGNCLGRGVSAEGAKEKKRATNAEKASVIQLVLFDIERARNRVAVRIKFGVRLESGTVLTMVQIGGAWSGSLRRSRGWNEGKLSRRKAESEFHRRQLICRRDDRRVVRGGNACGKTDGTAAVPPWGTYGHAVILSARRAWSPFRRKRRPSPTALSPYGQPDEFWLLRDMRGRNQQAGQNSI